MGKIVKTVIIVLASIGLTVFLIIDGVSHGNMKWYDIIISVFLYPCLFYTLGTIIIGLLIQLFRGGFWGGLFGFSIVFIVLAAVTFGLSQLFIWLSGVGEFLAYLILIPLSLIKPIYDIVKIKKGTFLD